MRGTIVLQCAQTRLRQLAAIALALSMMSGCAATHVEPWTPKPLVLWVDISTQTVRPVRGGYRILVPQPTRGLFPASLAVTRLAVEMLDERTRMTRPYLLADPRNEFLQWNRALDDQMAISEVFPVSGRDLGGGEASPEQILAAFHALHAKLGLIYAVNELTSTEAEMFGVLFEAATAQPIATLHAWAVSVPHRGPDGGGAADLWKSDARALVREKFERSVRACIRDLIVQDSPEDAHAPRGATLAGPLRPVEWPPQRSYAGPR